MDSKIITAIIAALVSLITGSIGTLVYFRQKRGLIDNELRQKQLELEEKERDNYNHLMAELLKCQSEYTTAVSTMSTLKRGLMLHNSAIRILIQNCDCPDSHPATKQIINDVEDGVGYFSVNPEL